MKNKKLLMGLALLCVVASIVMFNFRNDSHLSELGDFFWIPLPLGALALFGAMKGNKQA